MLGRPAVTLDDLKSFLQLDSRCPGHPEYRWTSGVETTTGPLGQGVATSVGMAIAGRLAARFNRPDFPLFDFDVYALAGDGCMMEGVASEAASLAGHLRLSNLCWIYDSNRVTIEGHTDITFTEDVAARFLAYGWNVTTIADANDLDRISRAFHTFRAETARPTLILVHSHIGYGSPVEDSPKAHGAPFGPEGVKATKRALGLPPDADFHLPDGVSDWFARVSAPGVPSCAPAGRRCSTPTVRTPIADELERIQRRELPDGWESALPTFPADPKGLASRDSSGQVLNAGAQAVPWVLGGSADLTPSTKTRLTFGNGRLPALGPGPDAICTSASSTRPPSPTEWR
ncbi:Transketolase OS=Streptomyces antimycoticus OX=68175 GN=tkt PE=3 SV=1 [Streptomyces antimycoticus]